MVKVKFRIMKDKNHPVKKIRVSSFCHWTNLILLHCTSEPHCLKTQYLLILDLIFDPKLKYSKIFLPFNSFTVFAIFLLKARAQTKLNKSILDSLFVVIRQNVSTTNSEVHVSLNNFFAQSKRL
jgi:hypothetical protein